MHATRPEPTPVPSGAARLWLSALIVAWGLQAIVTQSLLLREALVLMFGSEFAWGVVLFAWLLGVAVGGVAGGWLAERLRRPEAGLVVVLLMLSVAGCLELWIFRGARAWLGVPPGEFLPQAQTAVAAVVFVSPTSALIGLSFPLACRVGRRGAPHRWTLLSFGQVYALESAGSLVGGAAFTFWAVEHVAPIQIALLCGALTTATCAGLIATLQRRRVFAPVLLVIAVTSLLVAVLLGDNLERRLADRRWRTIAPGYALISQTESKYQNLAVGERAGQYTLYCDGQVTADFPDPYTFAPRAHFWLCEHPAPRSVLLLGGGAEGLLAEILRHPIEHVDYIESDARLIALLRPLLDEVDRQALSDPRVTVHHVDARFYVKTQQSRFDLVIARPPEPTSALRARYYTTEFFGELRRAMTPQAVLCCTATAAPGKLSPDSRSYLGSIRATLAEHFPQVLVGWGNPAQILAATGPGLITTDPSELERRYNERGVTSPLFDPAWFEGATDWLDNAKVAHREADLDQLETPEISTDLRPVVYLQRLVLWEAMTSGGTGPGRAPTGILHWLQSVNLTTLVIALASVGALWMLISRLHRRDRVGWAGGAVTLSVATTGFATMALSLIWLFGFQNLYGYVYQRIGWIIALFMAGLVVGCLWADRRRGRSQNSPSAHGIEDAGAWGPLVLVDVLLVLLAAAVPLVLPALAALQTGPRTLALVEWTISALVVATGVLGGAAFALAGRIQLAFTQKPGSAAGSVVGADHAGACLGALLCGILLVPVFGTAATAYLLAGMKLISALILIGGWRIAGASRTLGAT